MFFEVGRGFFIFEQRRKILCFVDKIVQKNFVFNSERYDLLKKDADYFFKKIRSTSQEYKEFAYLRDDFQDGCFGW